MERESFEDPEVADVLNRIFVCIKVDREERPDLDNIYMSVCQNITGSGGWPLTIFMSADKRPFFAGTYFPKNSSYDRVGLPELALKVEELWQFNRAELDHTANQVIASLQTVSAVEPGDLPEESVLHQAFEQLAERFDSQYGGFGSAPKFPSPHNLSFLLRYYKRTGNNQALQMVEKTLTAMVNGGVYDHIGFGFHRYSTDRYWLLPHFEKMLYDQALLAIAYLETYQATGKNDYADVAREIFNYVGREMSSPAGGFYSAEDADSERVEGKFYVWTAKETAQLLGKEDATLFSAVYNIRDRGNFYDEATGEPTELNIPHKTKSLQEIAAATGFEEHELKKRLSVIREKLFAEREKRIHPHKDDKILTDWNGLMIAAFAIGGRVLQDRQYTLFAQRAADFILQKCMKDGRLLKRYRDGESALPGHLDDYAFFIWGLLELYESSFEASFLEKALALNQTVIDHFWDHKDGSFYFTADDAEDLPVRHRELYDGAVPSGNSVAALNNLRLARLTGNTFYENIAINTAKAFSEEIKQMPQAYTQMLSALDFLIGPSVEIVIAGEPNALDTQKLLFKLYQSFVPNKVVLLHPTGHGSQTIETIAPFTKGQKSIDGKATAYVCRNFSCQSPVTDAESFIRNLT